MKILEDLERQLETEESYFRQHLIKEDVERLRTLSNLCRECTDADAFMKSGLRVGWTQGDMMTHRLKEFIEPLLEAIYDLETMEWTEEREEAVACAWRRFDHARMEKLIRCL